jgi:hypothetical protein
MPSIITTPSESTGQIMKQGAPGPSVGCIKFCGLNETSQPTVSCAGNPLTVGQQSDLYGSHVVTASTPYSGPTKGLPAYQPLVLVVWLFAGLGLVLLESCPATS